MEDGNILTDLRLTQCLTRHSTFPGLPTHHCKSGQALMTRTSAARSEGATSKLWLVLGVATKDALQVRSCSACAWMPNYYF